MLQLLWFRLLLILIALTPSALLAQFDPAKSPIELPPLARYEGSRLAPLAVIGDNSDFDLDNFPITVAGGQSFYQDLDIAGGSLFAAAGRTLEVYDIAPLPSAPNRPRALIRAQLVMPFWGAGDNGGSFFLNHVRAADEDLVAVGMTGQGLSVWKAASSGAPRVAYQDKGVFAKQIHIVSRDAVHWAFVADAGSGGGLMLYNLTNAEAHEDCLDDSPASTPCGDVFQGEIGNHHAIRALAGADRFVAVVPPGLDATVEILDATVPAQPVVKLTGSLARAPRAITDIALWKTSDALYLAAVTVVTSADSSTVEIYDVTCATTPGSCALQAPVVTIPASDPSGGNQSTISASSSGGRHFLHVGNQRRSGCEPQREYLFEVTDPNAPVDISPAVHAEGYWGWFYMDCDTGFNNIRPTRGYFFGDTFYRAAHSGLDAHRLVGIDGELIFTDDFESGDLTAWSGTEARN